MADVPQLVEARTRNNEQKAERERRLRSRRCFCPCGPPRLIVTSRRRLSIFCRGACAKRLVFDINAATTSALSSLRATPETDNCGGALWLASSARASSLLRSACYSFAYPAKNIRSARCRTSSGNRPIQQKSGRTRQKKILANLRLRPVRPKVFRTKLASQRRSHG